MKLVETPTYDPDCEKFDSFLGCCSETLMICREKLCPINKEVGYISLAEGIKDINDYFRKKGFTDIKVVEEKDGIVTFSMKAPECGKKEE